MHKLEKIIIESGAIDVEIEKIHIDEWFESIVIVFTGQERDKVMELYSIEFPAPLKQFFETVLPVSTGFCNWRDFSIKNIEFIKKVMGCPFSAIYSMPKEVYWNDE